MSAGRSAGLTWNGSPCAFRFHGERSGGLFDGYVRLQRRFGLRGRIPAGHRAASGQPVVVPDAADPVGHPVDDPDRPALRPLFPPGLDSGRKLFPDAGPAAIPRSVESRSLTLSKFDFQGKPHIFYDDHLHLLRRSDCFVARKIWPQRRQAVRHLPVGRRAGAPAAEPNPGKIDRLFAKAVERRTKGRPGLYMQSRFPDDKLGERQDRRALFGVRRLSDLFEDFETWLGKRAGTRVHGHLFAPDRVQFAGGEDGVQRRAVRQRQPARLQPAQRF